MKEEELRKHCLCSLCGEKIMARGGLPLFYRVTVERFGINLRAAQRQDGLAQFLGHTQLARIMGPDEDIASPLMEPLVLTVCETCSYSIEAPTIAGMVEIEYERRERERDAAANG